MHNHEIARICHEANRAICANNSDYSIETWVKAEAWQRESAIVGVQQVIDNPNITPEELHQKWFDFKKADGWIYGETKDAVAKTHPCMVSYGKLPKFQRDKDKVFRAIVKALMK